MHPSTPLTSVLPLPSPSQHIISSYNNSANPLGWNTTATTAAVDSSSNANYHQNHTSSVLQPPVHQQHQEMEKEVEMKPLDLSLRAPRQSDKINMSSWQRPSTSSSSSSRLGSQRLSPYPILSQSSGSLSSSPSYRHLGSPCLTQSRSPLTRSISPYYPFHRQSPSPYYLSGSCTPPDNCSSLQVLSSTNRLLNGLSSVSASHLRSYDDNSSSSPAPSDLMGVCESTRMIKDSDPSCRGHQHHLHHHDHHGQQQSNSNGDVDVDIDCEEPTYIDMDSSTTVVKSVSSRQQVQHDPRSNHGMSSVYTGTSVMSSSSSSSHHTPPMSQQHHNHPHEISSPSSSNHPAVVAAECSHPQGLPTFLQHNHQRQQQEQQQSHHRNNQAGSPEDYHQTATSCPSFISNNLQSSMSNSLPSLRSLSSTHTQYMCDSSNAISGDISCNTNISTSTNNIGTYNYCNNSDNKTTAPTSTLASNSDIDFVPDIRTYHQSNQQQQQQQQQHYHQNPDSSSSPPTNLEPSSSSASSSSSYSSRTSSSPWRATSTNAELDSPGNSNSSTNSGNCTMSSQQRPPSPQMSPDSNLSRSALSIIKGPSNNKENIRFINGRSDTAVSHNNTINLSHNVMGGGDNVSGSTSARRSFFQIDSSILEQNSDTGLLAEENLQNNDKSGRCSVLDFWISKILMEETPRRRCSADIRQTVDGNKKIRLRLVDLIELQVEQSLLKA